MTVLIVTKLTDNQSIDMVTRALEARGARAFRFDTDRFPTEVLIELGNRGGRMRDGERSLDLGEVSAVWYRRLDIAARLPLDMDAQLRAASVQEARATVNGMLAALCRRVFALDPPWVIRRGENKQLQLELAAEAGLEVPRSLSTNDPDAVRTFAAACPGGVVGKMLASFAVYQGGKEHVVYTTRMSDRDLAELEGLDLSPMTFQELVAKRVELRTTVVGDRVFTAQVESQKSARTEIDWRRDGIGLAGAWTPYDLPPTVERGLLALMDELELEYGAADFLVTPDGRHVFLEVNPAGEWFWLDQFTHLPIGEAIADVLTGSHRRRS